MRRMVGRWCQVDCVLDPETLFNEPGYLMEVAIGFDESDDETPADEGSPGILADSQDGTEARRRWRLLVIEDCDDLIRDEGRGSTGKALSRLLNLTDGLLGQGRDVLVALTTNEDLAQLHPAVVRPGSTAEVAEVVVHEGEHLFATERMVVSPTAGVFVPADGVDAGLQLVPGTVLGRVGDQEVRSPFAGLLVGMLAVDGERVTTSQPIAWLRTA